jgi:hypothetical protein
MKWNVYNLQPPFVSPEIINQKSGAPVMLELYRCTALTDTKSKLPFDIFSVNCRAQLVN